MNESGKYLSVKLWKACHGLTQVASSYRKGLSLQFLGIGLCGMVGGTYAISGNLWDVVNFLVDLFQQSCHSLNANKLAVSSVRNEVVKWDNTIW